MTIWITNTTVRLDCSHGAHKIRAVFEKKAKSKMHPGLAQVVEGPPSYSPESKFYPRRKVMALEVINKQIIKMNTEERKKNNNIFKLLLMTRALCSDQL